MHNIIAQTSIAIQQISQVNTSQRWRMNFTSVLHLKHVVRVNFYTKHGRPFLWWEIVFQRPTPPRLSFATQIMTWPWGYCHEIRFQVRRWLGVSSSCWTLEVLMPTQRGTQMSLKRCHVMKKILTLGWMNANTSAALWTFVMEPIAIGCQTCSVIANFRRTHFQAVREVEAMKLWALNDSRCEVKHQTFKHKV